MIELNVKKYCDECPYFEPYVINPEIMYCNGEPYGLLGDTHVYCTHKDKCARVYDYAIRKHRNNV